jgi:hypothetical protein
VEPERSVAEGPAVSFCPSDLTAPDKGHHPTLVIPSAAEGPAVRPGSHSKVWVSLVLTHNRESWVHISRRPVPQGRLKMPQDVQSWVFEVPRVRSQSRFVPNPARFALAARLSGVFLCQECQHLANNLKCRPNGSYIKPDRNGRTFVKLYLTQPDPSPRIQLLAERCEDPGNPRLGSRSAPTIGLC